ncbi:hypothetical protein RAMDARK_0262 [Rickettsia amblyommatis str. Darkwater]|nr:hypothetical protein RAMDARK_0262 [Rickettsia amblyommatis str. Darkwater]
MLFNTSYRGLSIALNSKPVIASSRMAARQSHEITPEIASSIIA